jgi:hypothetical protein
MTKFKTFDDLSKIRSIEDCAEAAEEIENMVKHMVAEDFNQIILDRFKNPKVHRPLMKVLVCRDMVHMFQKIFEAGKVAGKLEMLAETMQDVDEDEPDQYNRQVH